MDRTYLDSIFKGSEDVYVKLPKRVREELDVHIKFFKYNLTNLMKVCESPIEQLYTLALNDAIKSFRGDLSILDNSEIDYLNQAEVNVNGKVYRLDLLINCKVGSEIHHYAVECDGHDFHEKTKEQAARDRKRERDLMSVGYKVIRFTGSEIWKNPTFCARQTLQIIDNDFGVSEAWERLFKQD